MKLSIQERLELNRILYGYHSDSIEEIETVKSMLERTIITKNEAEKYGVKQFPPNYLIELEKDTDFAFDTNELKLLKSFSILLEVNKKINLNNLTLVKKLKAIEAE